MPEADGSQTREMLSWILTSILMLTILINFLYTFYQLSVRLKAYVIRVREENTRELLEA
jgi:hypothetical protein